MPRVVHVTSVHTLDDNRIFHKECTSLSKAGFDTALIVPTSHNDATIKDGVRVIPVKPPRNRMLRATKTQFDVFRKALNEDADIYHLHDPELLGLGCILRLLGKTVIFDMHENTPASILDKPWLHPMVRPWLNRLYVLIERILVNSMPVIFAENSYHDDYDWVKDSEVILNYPDISKITCIETIKRSQFTVGYIGMISWARGSDVTLNAISILQSQDIPIACVFVGPYSGDAYRESLSEECRNLKNNSAQFYGRTPPPEGLRIMSECHVGLAILQNIANYVDSYPTKIFEYMALGLPIVASNFPLYRNIIEKANCGICVDPSSAEEVAEALKWIMQNPDEAKRMGDRGFQAVNQHYSWQTQSDKLVNFYRTHL